MNEEEMWFGFMKKCTTTMCYCTISNSTSFFRKRCHTAVSSNHVTIWVNTIRVRMADAQTMWDLQKIHSVNKPVVENINNNFILNEIITNAVPKEIYFWRVQIKVYFNFSQITPEDDFSHSNQLLNKTFRYKMLV